MARAKEIATQTTQKKREKFLEYYREIGIVRDAANLAGIDRTSVYRWINSDEEFAKQFKEAKEEAVEKLEREAIRRAAEGVEKPVFYKGERIDIVREYSDNLLMFLLKGMKPEKYAERVKQDIKAQVEMKKLEDYF